MTEDGIFDRDTTAFDPERGRLSIKRSAFPLAYAAIRNFMTAVGALENEQQGEIGISDDYEDDFATVIRNRRKKQDFFEKSLPGVEILFSEGAVREKKGCVSGVKMILLDNYKV